jgi:hypothetical protein
VINTSPQSKRFLTQPSISPSNKKIFYSPKEDSEKKSQIP